MVPGVAPVCRPGHPLHRHTPSRHPPRQCPTAQCLQYRMQPCLSITAEKLVCSRLAAGGSPPTLPHALCQHACSLLKILAAPQRSVQLQRPLQCRLGIHVDGHVVAVLLRVIAGAEAAPAHACIGSNMQLRTRAALSRTTCSQDPTYSTCEIAESAPTLPWQL